MNTHNDPVLQVYVAAHCWQCPAALALAKDMADQFPELGVQVIDLDRPGVQPPAAVFAAPTFVLNGKIVSLGTPFHEELTRQIRIALQGKEQGSGEPRKDRLSEQE